MTAPGYRCPKCRGTLDSGAACAACHVRFRSRMIGSTKVLDFLRTTRPEGECHCPLENAGEPCAVSLSALTLPARGLRPIHPKARILKPLGALREKVILDVGCREAPIVHSLADANYVIGVDCCAHKMLQAENNALDKGYRELWIADAASLPLAERQADAVVATDLLEHVVTPELLLNEFYRVLKPGGKLLISVPNLVSYNNRLTILAGSGLGIELHLLLKGRSPLNPISGLRYPDQTQHLRFFTLKSLKQTLSACGFTVERAWGFDPVLSRIPLGERLLRNLCLLAVVLATK